MGKSAESYNDSDPAVLRGKLQLYQFAHGLQQRYNVPLSAVNTALTADKIMAALYDSLSIKRPEPPAGKDAIAYWEGHLSATLTARGTGNGDGDGANYSGAAPNAFEQGAALRRDSDPYGRRIPDYMDTSAAGTRPRMRTDSADSSAVSKRAAHASKIEARSGGRSRRSNSATGGEEFRTDSVGGVTLWRPAPGGGWDGSLIPSPPSATPPAPRLDTSGGEPDPSAAGDSVAPTDYVARLEGRSKRKKRTPKFHHS